jgi:hypothetical protein
LTLIKALTRAQSTVRESTSKPAGEGAHPTWIP